MNALWKDRRTKIRERTEKKTAIVTDADAERQKDRKKERKEESKTERQKRQRGIKLHIFTILFLTMLL